MSARFFGGVFVACFAGFLALHYFVNRAPDADGADQRTSLSTQSAAAADDRGPATDSLSDSDNASGEKTGLAAFLSRVFKPDDDSAELAKSQIEPLDEPYIYEYDPEWTNEFYAQLHSPESLYDETLDAPPVTVISGRVLTPSGSPVRGVEVTAEFRNYSAAATGYTYDNVPLSHKTRTNDDGFYAFPNLLAGIYMIGIEASAQFSVARLEVRTGIKNADLVLDSQRLVSVKGKVTDPMGGELKKVRIMPLVPGLPKGVITDKNGEFSLGIGLENPIQRFALRLQLDGYREQRYEVTEDDWIADGGIQLALTMEPVFEYATVTGNVSGPDGSQVADDYVRLYSPGLKRNYHAIVDGAGEFLFANVEIADDYQLWMRPTGPYRDFTEKNFVVGPGSMRRDIVLQPLDRSHRLSGRILDKNGNPVPNYTLTLRSLAASSQKLPITSNGFGEFEIDEVPQGELVFESRARPHHKISGLYMDGVLTERSVDLVINHGPHKLLGQVVNDSGKPIAAPRIFLTATTMKDGMQSSLSSTTSADAKGQFVFTDLASGEHTVTVHAPGYESIQVQPDINSHSELVIKLQKKKS